MRLTRRQFSTVMSSFFASSLLPYSLNVFAENINNDVTKKIIELEKNLGARMGVVIVDTDSGQQWKHRADERFPMCSTFKVLACGAVLARVDNNKENLNCRIDIIKEEIVSWSPVTEKYIGASMTLAEICEAAITHSDNTAANLILRSLGGPTSVTNFARSIGDPMTQLDRIEPELNEATPGDIRDTTTPKAMAENLKKLLVDDKLSKKSKAQLTAWLVANQTGDERLRAGLPKDWIIGDKTGTGEKGTVNDIAIIWPLKRKPVIVTLYITEAKASTEECSAAMAEIGRVLTPTLQQPSKEQTINKNL